MSSQIKIPYYRHTSPLFKSVPWLTDLLLRSDRRIEDFGEAQPRFKELVACLLEFQNQVTSQQLPSMEQKVFRLWINGIGVEDPSFPKESLSYWNQGRSCAIEALFAHRVLDIACALHESPAVRTDSSPTRNVAIPTGEHLKGVEDLKNLILGKVSDQNWVSLMKEAKKSLESVWSKELVAGTMRKQSQEYSVDAGLLRSALDRDLQASGSAMLANFEIASFHLRLIIKNGQMQSQDMLSVADGLGIILNDSERNYLERNFKKANFERPLFIALALSPLMLFSCKPLSRKTVRKVDYLNVLVSHEVQKSPEFQHVTLALWRVLFFRALGKPLKDLLQGFFAEDASNLTSLLISNENKAQLFFPCLVKKNLDHFSSPCSPVILGNEWGRPNPLSSLPNLKRLKSFEGGNGMDLDVSMNEVSLADGVPPPESTVLDLVIARNKAQQSSLPWKGKGKEVPMDIEEDGETPMDIDSSGSEEENEVFLHRKGTPQTENLTTSTKREHTNKQVKNWVQTENIPAVAKVLQTKKTSKGVQVANRGQAAEGQVELNETAIEKSAKSAAPGDKQKPAQGSSSYRIIEPSSRSLVVNQEIYQAREQDLMGWAEITLSAVSECGKPKFKGDTAVTYPIPGTVDQSIWYTPEVHFQDELDWFYNLDQSARSSYFEGKPCHIAQPQISCFKEISLDEWTGLSASAKQKLLKTKDIHVYDLNTNAKARPFNEDTLLEITESMTSVFTVHDHSIHDFKKQAKQGNLAIVYEHSQSATGSILNCLDLPGGNTEPDRAVSTDRTAFMATVNLPFCHPRFAFPQRSMRWRLCDLKHCSTRFHIDCHGFSTFFNVRCGTQLVYFATLAKGHSVGEINTFSPLHYNQDTPLITHWVIEAVVLQPGSTLYMRPCRPHAVVTLDHSVCEVGHMYTWSTIQETCFGIFHTFVQSQILTSTEHAWESRELLRRIVTYYHLHFVEKPQNSLPHHLPDLMSFTDVMHLLSLLNVVILGHIIYPPFYDNIPVESDPPREYLFGIGREKAVGLLTHLSKMLNLVKGNQRVDFKPLFITFLLQQVRSLVRHHSQCFEHHKGPSGDSQGCTTTALCQAIAASFSKKDWFFAELRRQRNIGYCNTMYAWVSEEEYSIENEKSRPAEEFDISFPTELHYNAEDEKMSALFDFLIIVGDENNPR